MTEKEKEVIIDALESGIALSKIYLERIEYLHEKYKDEEKDDFFIDLIETRRRIKTLEKLKDQYK